MPTPFELVIFDCDGVLVDSERIAVGVEARLLTELGYPHTVADVVERYLGRSSEAVLADIAGHLGEDGAARFDELSTREVHAAFERELTPVPGVVAVLEGLHAAEVPTCVASSGSHAKMRRTLRLTGLAECFSGRVYSADEVAAGKPAPDLFLHAASRMGVPPETCAVVEDSVYGVRAAVAAGMHVFGYAGGVSAADPLAEAGAEVFHEMGYLLPRLLHSSASSA